MPFVCTDRSYDHTPTFDLYMFPQWQSVLHGSSVYVCPQMIRTMCTIRRYVFTGDRFPVDRSHMFLYEWFIPYGSFARNYLQLIRNPRIERVNIDLPDMYISPYLVTPFCSWQSLGILAQFLREVPWRTCCRHCREQKARSFGLSPHSPSRFDLITVTKMPKTCTKMYGIWTSYSDSHQAHLEIFPAPILLVLTLYVEEIRAS